MEISGGILASISGRYASALFELAQEGNSIDAVAASLAAVAQALTESADLRMLTTSPLPTRSATVRAIVAVADSLGLDATTRSLLGVLAEHRRLDQLSAVIRDFDALVARYRGEITAEVASAHPLAPDQIAALTQQLHARLGQEVKLDLHVNPALLGGLVVKIGPQQIDSSIKTRLNSLAQAMKG